MWHHICNLLLLFSVGTIHAADPTLPPTTTVVPTSCPSPFELIGNQCLYFASFAHMSHNECNQICHGIDGELAAIRTATQFQKVIDKIHDKGLVGTGFWIDGSDAHQEGDWTFSDGQPYPMGTPFWAATEQIHAPDDIDGTQDCVALAPDVGFLMNDVACEEVQSPLCECIATKEDTEIKSDLVTSDVDCPPFFVDVGGNCLAFITWANQPWSDARQTCRGLSGDLASVNDIELVRDIYLYLKSEGIDGHSFWLGGSDEKVEGDWRWKDGNEVPPRAAFWGNSNLDYLIEPDGSTVENCLAITSEGEHYFRDKNCLNLYNPLCLTT